MVKYHPKYGRDGKPLSLMPSTKAYHEFQCSQKHGELSQHPSGHHNSSLDPSSSHDQKSSSKLLVLEIPFFVVN